MSESDAVKLNKTDEQHPQGSGARQGSGVPILLENVTKKYPDTDKPAVDSLNLEIAAGEIVVFVGPSGCGKTTTMRMINRLIEPTSGSIKIDGEDVLSLNAVKLRRTIGYVIQQVGLFPHLTIAQNVALVPKMLKWPKDKISSRGDELLELVGLPPGEYRDRYPRQLSGGQQQRVGVARALAADPPIMLMDEPFGAVDPITRARLQDEFLGLQDTLGKTIVFVTHDFDEAIKMGNRIAILREGSAIAQYATPEEILANPADDFVEGFIGSGATLKRLALERLADVDLRPAAEAGSNPSTISIKATLDDVLDMMLGDGHDILAVTRHGTTVGSISLDDLLQRVAELRAESAQRSASEGMPT